MASSTSERSPPSPVSDRRGTSGWLLICRPDSCGGSGARSPADPVSLWLEVHRGFLGGQVARVAADVSGDDVLLEVGVRALVRLNDPANLRVLGCAVAEGSGAVRLGLLLSETRV